jgi:chemotaxis protein MotB
MHQLLLTNGLDEGRVQRVSGFADRKALTLDPTLIRNNRLEVILLRSNP